jgi:DNA-binding NtrC family response regulator
MVATKSILVLDDEVEIGLLLSETLRDAGYSVSCFTCVNEAKTFIEGHYSSIDFIITDYHLAPNTTGLDVIRFCHQIVDVPYILISGNMGGVEDSYNKNEIARLDKPFCNDDILKFITSS